MSLVRPVFVLVKCEIHDTNISLVQNCNVGQANVYILSLGHCLINSGCIFQCDGADEAVKGLPSTSKDYATHPMKWLDFSLAFWIDIRSANVIIYHERVLWWRLTVCQTTYQCEFFDMVHFPGIRSCHGALIRWMLFKVCADWVVIIRSRSSLL